MRSLISRHRESISGLLNLGGSRLLLTGMSFVSSILIARGLGAEQLGIFAIITGAFAYVSIFSEFGLRATITAEASRRGDAGAVFGPYIRLRLAIAALSYAITMATTAYFYPVHLKPTALIMLGIFFFALQIDWILLVNRRYKAAGWISMTRWAAYLALIATTMQLWQLDIVSLAQIFLCSWIIAALSSWVAVIRTGGSFHPRENHEAPPNTRQLLTIGAPVLGATLVSQALQNADLLWVGKTLGARDAGHYYLANSIIGAGLIFANAIGQMASAQYAGLQEDSARVVEKFKYDIRLLTLISAAIAFFLLTCAKPLVPLFFGNEYTDTGLLVIDFIPYLILYHFWSLMFSASIALGMEKVLFRAKLATIVLLPALLAIATLLNTLSAFAIVKGLILLPAIFLIYRKFPNDIRRGLMPTLTLCAATTAAISTAAIAM